MDELKACPLCASSAESYHAGWGGRRELFVACSSQKCPLYVVTAEPAAWNTRPIEDALLARAEKAEVKHD